MCTGMKCICAVTRRHAPIQDHSARQESNMHNLLNDSASMDCAGLVGLWVVCVFTLAVICMGHKAGLAHLGSLQTASTMMSMKDIMIVSI